jgi:sulfatase modifying factor 1
MPEFSGESFGPIRRCLRELFPKKFLKISPRDYCTPPRNITITPTLSIAFPTCQPWKGRLMKIACSIALLAVVFLSIFSAPCAVAAMFGSGANAFEIRFATIGDPGNPPDTTGNPNPAGSVPYSYRIGQLEISEQMIDKANALGGLGITKTTRGPDKPATQVSWNEAARFVNWLNTSTGFSPAYKFALQPGDVGYNSNADIELWTIADAGYDPANLYRNSQARYFLPSGNEWYKAAYYDPASGVYYDYPTGSDTVPTAVGSGTAAGTAVYTQPFGNGPADVMAAGGLSPYGTMGQGGNVFELEETDFDLLNGPTVTTDLRGLRGGYWSSGAIDLQSLTRRNTSPTNQQNFIGFRVASVIPEPGTVLLAALAGLGLLWRRPAR